MSASPVAPATAEALLRARRSSRRFLPKPVPESTIRSLVELASTAPSGSNTQPWTVEVVSGKARDQLSELLVADAVAGRFTPDFPYDPSAYDAQLKQRQRETGALVYAALGIAREDHERRQEQYLDNLRFFGAPHVALMFLPKEPTTLMINDIGMFSQNLLLAMTANGIASCTQAFIAMHAGVVRDFLDIGDRKLIYGISFGYADAEAPINQVRTTRVPAEAFLRLHA